MQTQTINATKKINLRWSDLFLLLGFLCFSIFLVYGQLHMRIFSPDELDLKPLQYIILFTLNIIFWGIYIYLEYERGNKAHHAITIIIFILIGLGIASILLQPSTFNIEAVDVNGQIIPVSLDIVDTHKLFFVFDIILILLFIYIGLFIFPKRFNTLIFIKLLGWGLFLLCLVVTIYSLVTEFDKYQGMIETVQNQITGGMKSNAVKSFVINSNAVGMIMLMGIIFSCVMHSITRKIWYLFLPLFFFTEMFFSFCRTSLLIAPIIYLLYLYHYLIVTFKHRLVGKIVTICIVTVFLLSLISVLLISFFSKGEMFPVINFLISETETSFTISGRTIIWNDTYQIIANNLPLSLIFGNGFGIMNMELLVVNYINGFGEYTFPTHNSYLTLLAEGGFIYLFAYLALLIYVLIKLCRHYKKSPVIVIGLSLGIVAFSIYSLIETIHYLVYAFMALAIIFDEVMKKDN